MLRYALKRAVASAVLGSVLIVSSLSVFASPSQKAKKVTQTFAFFGCNRIDQKDWEATRKENPSSANIPQLRQNLTDIAHLAPNTVFFGGDLVIGYADDNGENLRSQMTGWFDLVKTLPRAPKTQYVVFAGNHEVNRKIGEQRLPNPKMDAVWTDLLLPTGYLPFKREYPTPHNSPKDNLVSDQKALTFSFNRGAVHFVVLNTDTRVTTKDPKTGETKIAMIPTQWLKQDLDAAEKNHKIKCVVVMGHRNLVAPANAKGEAPIDPECTNPTIEVFKSHPKVRVYVCAHVHAFDITEIGTSGVKQTIFGNGGSKLEKEWNPTRGRTFGFGYFKVYSDGSLGVVPYLRPEPKNYTEMSSEQVVPATPEAEIILPVR